ncbi:MAG: TlpA disulfide reductase family protein [Sterolibacterium sp.]
MKQALLFIFWLIATASGVSAKTPGEVEVGGYLREAPLYGFFGDYRKLSEFRGKPLIINVWASWCGPCRAEMGSLERLSRRFGRNKLTVIGISTDDDATAATGFLNRARITFENYLDRNLLLENMLGANTIPLTILVDAQGRVVEKINGARDWDSPESLAMIVRTLHLKK